MVPPTFQKALQGEEMSIPLERPEEKNQKEKKGGGGLFQETKELKERNQANPGGEALYQACV